MIELLKLQSKKNKAASTLSGGQKRKLSVGIALGKHVKGRHFVFISNLIKKYLKYKFIPI